MEPSSRPLRSNSETQINLRKEKQKEQKEKEHKERLEKEKARVKREKQKEKKDKERKESLKIQTELRKSQPVKFSDDKYSVEYLGSSFAKQIYTLGELLSLFRNKIYLERNVRAVMEPKSGYKSTSRSVKPSHPDHSQTKKGQSRKRKRLEGFSMLTSKDQDLNHYEFFPKLQKLSDTADGIVLTLVRLNFEKGFKDHGRSTLYHVDVTLETYNKLKQPPKIDIQNPKSLQESYEISKHSNCFERSRKNTSPKPKSTENDQPPKRRPISSKKLCQEKIKLATSSVAGRNCEKMPSLVIDKELLDQGGSFDYILRFEVYVSQRETREVESSAGARLAVPFYFANFLLDPLLEETLSVELFTYKKPPNINRKMSVLNNESLTKLLNPIKGQGLSNSHLNQVMPILEISLTCQDEHSKNGNENESDKENSDAFEQHQGPLTSQSSSNSNCSFQSDDSGLAGQQKKTLNMLNVKRSASSLSMGHPDPNLPTGPTHNSVIYKLLFDVPNSYLAGGQQKGHLSGGAGRSRHPSTNSSIYPFRKKSKFVTCRYKSLSCLFCGNKFKKDFLLLRHINCHHVYSTAVLAAVPPNNRIDIDGNKIEDFSDPVDNKLKELRVEVTPRLLETSVYDNAPTSSSSRSSLPDLTGINTLTCCDILNGTLPMNKKRNPSFFYHKSFFDPKKVTVETFHQQQNFYRDQMTNDESQFFSLKSKFNSLFNNISYFNTTAMLPLQTDTLGTNIDIDSEDEIGENVNKENCKLTAHHTSKDPDWEISYSKYLIDDFDDVSKSEKAIMNLWNHFVNSGGCRDDESVGLCVKGINGCLGVFLERKIDEIKRLGLEKEVVNFLRGFVSFGHISTRQFCMLVANFNGMC